MTDEKEINQDAVIAVETVNALLEALQKAKAELYAKYSGESERSQIDELVEKTLAAMMMEAVSTTKIDDDP